MASTSEEMRKRDWLMVILIIISVILASIFGCTPKQVIVAKQDYKIVPRDTMKHPRYEKSRRIHYYDTIKVN